jgi:predicted O-methyltransferase YrrM
MPEPNLPESVRAATERAGEVGFELSSDPNVGRMLRMLAAAVRPNGRILEIGTGMGVGTAWLLEGLAGRQDVEVVTIEFDPARANQAAQAGWPAFVKPVVGDALVEVPRLGTFSLVFADAEAGKIFGLDCTLEALERQGVLVLDDMRFCGRNPAIEDGIVKARKQVFADERFVSVEIGWATGLILATRVK